MRGRRPRRSSGHDERAHASCEAERDGEPLAAPVVGGLGHHGAEDNGKNVDGLVEPNRLGGRVEVCRHGLRLLTRPRVSVSGLHT